MGVVGFFEIKKFLIEPSAFKFIQTRVELSEVFSWLVTSSKLKSLFSAKFLIVSLIQNLFINFFGLSLSLLIGKLVFSTLNIFVFYRIYQKYTNQLWSVFLTLISVISFSTFPFREFIVQLFQGKLMANMAMVDIISFPMPSVSIFFFLTGFYLTMESKKIDTKRSIFLAIFWALQLYVNAFNFYFGWPLWLATIYFRVKSSERIKYLLISIFFALILSIPWLYSCLSEFDSPYTYFSSGPSFISKGQFNNFYYLLYFFFPIFLLFITYIVLKIDYFELLKRFYFVPVFILLELIAITTDGIYGTGRLSNYIFSRLFMFVHFFYLIPIIHLFLRPYVVNPRYGTESSPIFQKVAWFFRSVIDTWSKYLLPVQIVLLILFGSISSRNSYEKKAKFIVENKLFFENGSVRASCPVQKNIIQELMGNLDANKTVFMNNRFSSNLSETEILKRMIIFFKTNSLSQAEFEEFIRSKRLDNLEFVEIENLSNQTFIKLGLGRWLLFGQSISLGNEVRQSFYDDAIRLFNDTGVSDEFDKQKCL